MPFRYASLCDGIGAAHVAWSPIGWRCAWTSEIEPFPCAVVDARWGLPNLGDMTKITEDQVEEHGRIDLVVGGTPCQSFSVAGLRKGMADPRGNLAIEFLRLVDATRPRWVVWENVPGVLSSNKGRDFGSIVGALGELGYGWAYRVLDAQHVRVDGLERAVPQRRRRVFVVGCLGSWQRAAAVLFERESLCGNTAPRREAGSRVAALTARGVGTCGADDNQAQAGHLIASTGNVAHCLNAGAMGRLDFESETMVAHSLRGEGFDANAGGTGRGTPLVFDTTNVTSKHNRSNPKPGDPCHTIAAGMDAPAIAFHSRQDPITAPVSLPLEAKGGQAVAFAIQERAVSDNTNAGPGGKGYKTGTAYTLESRHHVQAVATSHVRRLTPRECERLMGFPDDYTLIEYRGKPAADGPRYKALGNSMAINCMRWIGRRIEMVEAFTEAA